MKDKFVYLSKTNLAKVLDWCEANENDPIAEAYMGACGAIGAIDCSKISDRLEKSWKGPREGKRGYGWIEAAYKLDDLAYMHRDTIGRAILNMLKREQPNA